MTMPGNWVDLRRDAETGIETIRAHFQGHAYDAHWHDSYLLGVTEQGVQQFDCRGRRVHSRPGQVFMLEPGEIHNGDAPMDEGFTYAMLYLPTAWLEGALRQWRDASGLPDGDLCFARTLADAPALGASIRKVFALLRQMPPRITRDIAVDALLTQLTEHSHIGNSTRGFGRAGVSRNGASVDPICADASFARDEQSAVVFAARARDYLHAHLEIDVGLDALAEECGTDRFTLTRAFKARYGVAPHAYLVQLRLVSARARLAHGEPVADVAQAVGFADQSHLGRWFRRVYGVPPAQYGKAAQTFQTAPFGLG
ncbi:AraC family transcriptional regulator [Robbsia sp. KACC 23696]|uniref:AraC family transcriptional regulator n=1 Tax=Robbsia sp. KACC 23696 TaxID=3149231 RepID=UPI00325B6242